MKYDALKLFGKEVMSESERFYKICIDGKRWRGNPLLIVLDACLDSTGLKYFTVVVPKVKEFEDRYVKTGTAKICSDFRRISRDELLELFGNPRAWDAMQSICGFLSDETSNKEFKKLKEWAVDADPYQMKSDSIGKIKGVGINTFQYLRIQSGVETIMPDKVIARWIARNFKPVNNPYECINAGMELSHMMRISAIQLCWAIWIKESGELRDMSKVNTNKMSNSDIMPE